MNHSNVATHVPPVSPRRNGEPRTRSIPACQFARHHSSASRDFSDVRRFDETRAHFGNGAPSMFQASATAAISVVDGSRICDALASLTEVEAEDEMPSNRIAVALALLCDCFGCAMRLPFPHRFSAPAAPASALLRDDSRSFMNSRAIRG